LGERLASYVGGTVGKAEAPGAGRGYDKKTTINFEDDTIEGELVQPDSAYVMERKRQRKSRPKRSRSRERSAPSAMPPPSPAAQDSYRSMSTTSGAAASSRGPSQLTKNLPLFERPLPRRTFSDPYLPAVTAGGLDYV
jgi:hypothetical protein